MVSEVENVSVQLPFLALLASNAVGRGVLPDCPGQGKDSTNEERARGTGSERKQAAKALLAESLRSKRRRKSQKSKPAVPGTGSRVEQ